MTSSDYLLDSLSDTGSAFESGFATFLAIVRNAPREYSTPASITDVQAQNIIAASSFEMNYEQSVVNQGRLAGEGAESSTFSVSKAAVKSTLKSPLYAPVTGWVHPAFAMIWDATKSAYWGTGAAAAATTTESIAIGSNFIIINNIMDFVSLPKPFALNIWGLTGESNETVNVVSVDKKTRTLTLASPVAHVHSNGTFVVSFPNYPGGARTDPAFSLLSLKEGLLAPSMIDKLTIDVNLDKNVEYTANILSLGIDRQAQPTYRSHLSSLLQAFYASPPDYLINPATVSLATISATTGHYGLPSQVGDPLFSGFQGLGVSPISVTGFSITIDNHLEFIYSSHSLAQGDARRRENTYPRAIVCNGRSITGTLKYRSVFSPYALMEKIAGNSDLNGGGIVLNLGPCQIAMPEIAWKPSSGASHAEGTHERTLEWQMLSQSFDSMPYLAKT